MDAGTESHEDKTSFCTSTTENHGLPETDTIIYFNDNFPTSSTTSGSPCNVDPSFACAPCTNSVLNKEEPNDVTAPDNSILLIGDDNFTFTPCFLESRHLTPSITSVEVTSCLTEEKIPNDFRPNYLALVAQGIKIHFGINPAQLRNHFFHKQYCRIIFILPGIAFSGFPLFLDEQYDPLFRLRLHMFAFSFLKSSKNAVRPDGLIQFLWPRQNDRNELSKDVPWHSIEIAKIGPFCEVFRSVEDDETLETSAFYDWRPLIHNKAQSILPIYLYDSVFYSWRVSPPRKEGNASRSEPTSLPSEEEEYNTEDKDCNLLFVPAGLWNFSIETLSHVNEVFKFEMKTHDGGIVVVSKPTLKFDPRFRSDGALAKNPFMKYGKMRNCRGLPHQALADYSSRQFVFPPPPPPPDCPLAMMGDPLVPNSFVAHTYGYHAHDLMMSLMHEQHPRWLMHQPSAWDTDDRMMLHCGSNSDELSAMNSHSHCAEGLPVGSSSDLGYHEPSYSKYMSEQPSRKTQEMSDHPKSGEATHDDVLLYESLEQAPYGFLPSYLYDDGTTYDHCAPPPVSMSGAACGDVESYGREELYDQQVSGLSRDHMHRAPEFLGMGPPHGRSHFVNRERENNNSTPTSGTVPQSYSDTSDKDRHDAPHVRDTQRTGCSSIPQHADSSGTQRMNVGSNPRLHSHPFSRSPRRARPSPYAELKNARRPSSNYTSRSHNDTLCHTHHMSPGPSDAHLTDHQDAGSPEMPSCTASPSRSFPRDVSRSNHYVTRHNYNYRCHPRRERASPYMEDPPRPKTMTRPKIVPRDVSFPERDPSSFNDMRYTSNHRVSGASRESHDHPVGPPPRHSSRGRPPPCFRDHPYPRRDVHPPSHTRKITLVKTPFGREPSLHHSKYGYRPRESRVCHRSTSRYKRSGVRGRRGRS